MLKRMFSTVGRILKKPAKPASPVRLGKAAEREREAKLRGRVSQSSLEPLEGRIAPAAIVSPGNALTYTDKHGDLVTVKFSQAIVNTGDANLIFKFDTGSVDGFTTTTQQQLELIDLHLIA